MKLIVAARLARVFVHVAAGLATCALLFPFVPAVQRERLVGRWSRRLLRICRVQLAETGAPLAHALLAANHVSWLDIFVINALAPAHFVAKAEIRAWPVLGWLTAQAGTVFIARGSRRDLRHTFKGIVDQLERGGRVAFFPEGTTAPQGALLAFHANLFEAAIDAGVAVQPLALAYLDDSGSAHAAVEFTGDMTFAGSMLAILGGPPVQARLCWLAPLDARGAHRRALSAAARVAIDDALGDVLGGQVGGRAA